MAMIEPRGLSTAEAALLEAVLGGEPFPDARLLAAQINIASVTGGLPTFLDLEVPSTVAAADVADGPVPIRAFIEAPNGDIEGEVIVWVKSGYLAGLEFAWYTDDAPAGMPAPDRLRVQRHD